MVTEEMRLGALRRLSEYYLSEEHDKRMYLLLQGVWQREPNKEALKAEILASVENPKNLKEWATL